MPEKLKVLLPNPAYLTPIEDALAGGRTLVGTEHDEWYRPIGFQDPYNLTVEEVLSVRSRFDIFLGNAVISWQMGLNNNVALSLGPIDRSTGCLIRLPRILGEYQPKTGFVLYRNGLNEPYYAFLNLGNLHFGGKIS